MCAQRSSALPYMANISEETIGICVDVSGLNPSDGGTLPQGNMFTTEDFNVPKSFKSIAK